MKPSCHLSRWAKVDCSLSAWANAENSLSLWEKVGVRDVHFVPRLALALIVFLTTSLACRPATTLPVLFPAPQFDLTD